MHNAASVAAGAPQTASLFNIRQVVELARAHATPIVDFSKAFDSVNHEALWEVLEARSIHPKLISLIKDLYEGNR